MASDRIAQDTARKESYGAARPGLTLLFIIPHRSRAKPSKISENIFSIKRIHWARKQVHAAEVLAVKADDLSLISRKFTW